MDALSNGLWNSIENEIPKTIQREMYVHLETEHDAGFDGFGKLPLEMCQGQYETLRKYIEKRFTVFQSGIDRNTTGLDQAIKDESCEISNIVLKYYDCVVRELLTIKDRHHLNWTDVELEKAKNSLKTECDKYIVAYIDRITTYVQTKKISLETLETQKEIKNATVSQAQSARIQAALGKVIVVSTIVSIGLAIWNGHQVAKQNEISNKMLTEAKNSTVNARNTIEEMKNDRKYNIKPYLKLRMESVISNDNNIYSLQIINLGKSPIRKLKCTFDPTVIKGGFDKVFKLSEIDSDYLANDGGVIKTVIANLGTDNIGKVKVLIHYVYNIENSDIADNEEFVFDKYNIETKISR
jgi:hypothetical protein